jgi:hypothetical protein
MKRLALPLLSGAWLSAQAPAWMRFRAALRTPARAQEEVLRRIVASSAGSAFGREHRLTEVRSITDFQRRVPVRGYDAYEPWIDRVARGESQVLSGEPVLMMERSGGSTRATKLVPYTRALRSEFAAATGAWIFDMYRRHPGLAGCSSYWSVSQVARGREHTPGGVPIGFEDDTEYFSPLERWALSHLLAVPKALVHEPDVQRWRFETCRHLLEARELGLISVWSPTFLTLLMQAIERDLPQLLARLGARRADEIERGLDRAGRVTGTALWPGLRLVSAWADGPSADFVSELCDYFPGVRLAPKGLLATEGVVSIPFGDDGPGTLALTSHFLEFLSVDDAGAPPLLAHELRLGGRYSPLLTTGGGLHRYHLKDVVECVGSLGAAPRIRFVEKLERTSDLCGEKLSASFVRDALDQLQKELGLVYRFALLAPVVAGRNAEPHYRLYVESAHDERTLARAAERLEELLSQAHHYAYCRSLGQLGPLDCRRVQRGAEVYQDTLRERGQRAGDIKPTCIDAQPVWDERFARFCVRAEAVPS